MQDESTNGGEGTMPNGRPLWMGMIGSAQEANALLERSLEAASPNAIFQEPVIMGDTAVITIRPDGVKVEPIVDLTKLGIAALSALIALIMARGQVKRTLAGR